MDGWRRRHVPVMPISQCACLIYTVTQMGRFTALVEAAGAKYTFEVMAEYTQVGANGGLTGTQAGRQAGSSLWGASHG